ncbi:MAG: DMT family transporter [Clostridia bacterium]|nr:DMT family transporter [Clostridia bacterium]
MLATSFGGLVAVIMAALSFGSGHLVRKLRVLEVPSPFWGVAIGSTVAWLAMLAQAALQGRLGQLWHDNFHLDLVPRPYLLAGLFTALGQLSNYLGIYLAPVSLATVLAATEPLHTLALSRLVLGREEPLGRWLPVYAGIMVAGISLLFVDYLSFGRHFVTAIKR